MNNFVYIQSALLTSSAKGDKPRTFEMTFVNEYFKLLVLALYWIEFREINRVLVG